MKKLQIHEVYLYTNNNYEVFIKSPTILRPNVNLSTSFNIENALNPCSRSPTWKFATIEALEFLQN